MFEAASSVLSIFSVVEKVYGRKKIQKMVHLLEAAGTRMPFKYEYHYYGPYSAELQAELNDLAQQGFLRETTHDETYVYEITDKGRKFKEKLDQFGITVAIDKELVQSMVQQSSQFLEMVSTYAFLINAGYEPGEAKNKAIELKSHLKDLVDKAISYYNEQVATRSK
ncbi:hypothetical protein Theco_3398 [Thermobacillus composti KWC4]|uniref:Uncharacterized protein n=1 Tax=Thermobacillus composti (strain DSM 18247 / JCM 13945 / KWC4) TaxID=717605 RepID=L0EJP7_THECK|nr:hypothetical protein [Thermobacillus composti]AGA59445.1 hypothetical protein Theco_3398 [Thermobacillus composti KWC4]